MTDLLLLFAAIMLGGGALTAVYLNLQEIGQDLRVRRWPAPCGLRDWVTIGIIALVVYSSALGAGLLLS